MQNTSIEWAHHTFNPWIGCTRVSPGCDHCYAENLMDTRYGRVKWGDGNPRSRTSESYWRDPYKWNRLAAASGVRERVFCASLADVLDDQVPVAWLMDLLNVIRDTPHLDWLLLTHREHALGRIPALLMDMFGVNLLPNIWLGVSAELQPLWNRRVRLLMETPAVVHFVSVEPMLGGIQLNGLFPEWVICGGESGAGARGMFDEWVIELMMECQACDIPFFFKQWGGVNKKAAGRELLGRTYDEFPVPMVGGLV